MSESRGNSSSSGAASTDKSSADGWSSVESEALGPVAASSSSSSSLACSWPSFSSSASLPSSLSPAPSPSPSPAASACSCRSLSSSAFLWASSAALLSASSFSLLSLSARAASRRALSSARLVSHFLWSSEGEISDISLDCNTVGFFTKSVFFGVRVSQVQSA